MKTLLSLIFAVSTFSCCVAQQPDSGYKPNIVPADDPHIQYVGRISYRNPKAPQFGFTASQIYANFNGTSISMIMKPNSGFYMVELDDQPVYKIQSMEDSVVTIAKGLDPGNHYVSITQCNEAVLVKFPTFHGFILDDSATIGEKPTLPNRRIEFIGNSITCALGIEDTTAAHNASPAINYQNAYYSYAALTARKLNAQYVVIARSGIGVYRNNGGNRYGDTKVMPYYYPRSTYSDNSEMWDFRRYTPDVVCINLGTNDTSQTYETNLLATGMTKFLRTVHGKYPHAKIVLLTGTMRKGQRLADLKSALDTAVLNLKNDGIGDIYRLDFTPADGTLGYGTGLHPSMKQHSKMADELVPFLKRIMNW